MQVGDRVQVRDLENLATVKSIMPNTLVYVLFDGDDDYTGNHVPCRPEELLLVEEPVSPDGKIDPLTLPVGTRVLVERKYPPGSPPEPAFIGTAHDKGGRFIMYDNGDGLSWDGLSSVDILSVLPDSEDIPWITPPDLSTTFAELSHLDVLVETLDDMSLGRAVRALRKAGLM